VVSARVSTITSYKLSQFKLALLNIKPEVLRAKVNDSISQKQKKAQEDAIKEAVGRAQAEAQAEAKAQAKAPVRGWVGRVADVFV
jgi:hypothetical protein